MRMRVRCDILDELLIHDTKKRNYGLGIDRKIKKK